LKKSLTMLSLAFLFISILAATSILAGQQEDPRQALTAADYDKAAKFLSAHTAPLVFGASVRPTWLDAERFWYRNRFAEGFEFVLVDTGKRTRKRAFDHKKLAAALSIATDTTCKPFDLPFTSFEFSDDGHSLVFNVKSQRYTYDIQNSRCTALKTKQDTDRNSIVSPDGKHAAFIRDYNLWVRDLTSGEDTQLTTDGIKDFGYATNNAGWTKSKRPVLLWSPDSKKIATFQHDGRGVGEMYLVSTNVGHPKLQAWKYPLPEDKEIFRIHRIVIHLDGARVIRLQMPPDQHRSTICDHIVCRGSGFSDVEWSPDSTQLAFVSTSRDHKHEVLRMANPETGAIRDVLEETVDTFFESGFNMVNWHALPESNEVIWFSQRDNWGHLYLYDLKTGQLPYFQYFYSVRMDGKDFKLLTPENANHTITLSPPGTCFVDSYSTPVSPPVTVLRDVRGRKRLTVEEADISRLIAAGWIPPIPFTVKARDGETDLYGLMFKPTNFDPKKKYPIINYIYPGPQTGSLGSRSFSASRGDKQSIAELGFIVVGIDAMGTPMRSKSFHAALYGNMGDNGLPDQITGMKQLAKRYSWIDIERAGIYGHSGGGFASTDAILRYPEFFKVAVSGAGNHDNRNYEDDWGEKWQGLLKTNSDGTTNYDNQANQLLAKNLKGKLLLAHGTLDTNVPLYNTLLVVNELIAANKDFDLILFPNRSHGFGNEPYMMRRRWDYFVKHLMGAEPPQEYKFKVNTSRR